MEGSRSKTRAVCYPGGSDFICNAMERARKMGRVMGHGFGNRSRAVVILNSKVLREGRVGSRGNEIKCHSFQDYNGTEYEM